MSIKGSVVLKGLMLIKGFLRYLSITFTLSICVGVWATQIDNANWNNWIIVGCQLEWIAVNFSIFVS